MIDHNLLLQSLLFKDISREALTTVSESAFLKHLKESELLFLQDDAAYTLYMVLEGRLKLFEENAAGEDAILRYIGPSEVTAAASVVKNAHYPATAMAVEHTVVCGWENRTLHDLMMRYSRIALNMLSVVTDRLYDMQARFLELKSEQIEQRIARTLLRLVRRSGRKTPEGIVIDFPLSRQDVAEFSGTTLYSVSRTLSAWEKAGVIKSHRMTIIIQHPHRLNAIAENL